MTLVTLDPDATFGSSSTWGCRSCIHRRRPVHPAVRARRAAELWTKGRNQLVSRAEGIRGVPHQTRDLTGTAI